MDPKQTVVDDDDNDQLPIFLRRDFKINIDDDDDDDKDSSISNDYIQCKRIEMLWLQRNVNTLQETLTVLNASSIQNKELINTVQLILQMLHGLHIQFFHSINESDEPLRTMIMNCLNSKCSGIDIRKQVFEYIYNNNRTKTTKPNCYRCLQIMAVGTLLLELYCQANYTGPEILPQDISLIFGTDDENKQNETIKYAIAALECDGDYPFHICSMPQLLYVSRCLLSILANSEESFWQSGVYLDSDGFTRKYKFYDSQQYVILENSPILFKEQNLHQQQTAHNNDSTTTTTTNNNNNNNNNTNNNHIMDDTCINTLKQQSIILTQLCGACLPSRHWRHSRASIIHFRLLQNQSFENIPTLWRECHDAFHLTIQYYGKHMQMLQNTKQAIAFLKTDSILEYSKTIINRNLSTSSSCSTSVGAVENLSPIGNNCDLNSTYSNEMLESQLWLEWGLCQHYFQYKDKVSQ
jgi:hypothetical protein